MNKLDKLEHKLELIELLANGDITIQENSGIVLTEEDKDLVKEIVSKASSIYKVEINKVLSQVNRMLEL